MKNINKNRISFKSVVDSLLVPRVLSGAVLLLFAAGSMASAQTRSYGELRAEHPDWLQVPGALARPDCVHQIPSGATVDTTSDKKGDDVILNGKVIAHYDRCPEQAIDTRHVAQDPGTGNGWVEAAQWDTALKSGDNIDFLYGYWTVPSAPENDGALIFLFNGVEPSPSGWIMQPVLQYGDNGHFGGDYWVLASWLVHSNTDFYVSTPINVNPGDTIEGALWQTASGKTLGYRVDASDQTTGQNSTLKLTSTGYQWIWAYAGVLEAYRVTSCSQFPSGSDGVASFVETHVYHGYPKSELLSNKFYSAKYNYGGPSCNFNVEISGGSATLQF